MDKMRTPEISRETGGRFRMTSILLKRVREMVKLSFGRLPAHSAEVIDAAVKDVESGKVDLEQ